MLGYWKVGKPLPVEQGYRCRSPHTSCPHSLQHHPQVTGEVQEWQQSETKHTILNCECFLGGSYTGQKYLE